MKLEMTRSVTFRRDEIAQIVQIRNQLVAPLSELHMGVATMLKLDGSPIQNAMLDFDVQGVHPDDTEKQHDYLATIALYAMLAQIGLDPRTDPFGKQVAGIMFPYFKIFMPEEVAKNPYLQKITVPEISKDGFALGYNSYAAGEYILYETGYQKDLPPMMSIPRFGIFNQEFRYPQATKDNSVWMTITPNEINTIQPHIDIAKGNVLTLGLGLGYFAYVAHLKPDVNHVTVVEYDPAAIELFQTHILPQFDDPDKISIIQADAVEYIKNLKDGEFDTCFADIWKDTLDISPYLAVKTAARHLKKTKMTYWIEDSLLDHIIDRVYCQLCIDLRAAAIRKFHFDPFGIDDNNAKIDDDLSRFVKALTSQEKIQSARDVDRILDPDYISGLITRRKHVTWPPDIREEN